MDTLSENFGKSMGNVKTMCGKDGFRGSRESKQKNQRKA